MRAPVTALLVGLTALAGAAEPGKASRSPISVFRIDPVRILWESARGVAHGQTLLAPQAGQPVLEAPLPPCTLETTADAPAGILLDFGREIQGHVELFTPMAPDKEPTRARIRFGESAGEAMAELGGVQNAGNDHAVRDQIVTLPWLGTQTIGPSGFRFVRIDAVDPGRPVRITQVRAVLGIRDVPRIGSFRSSDARLNRIWEVGADTVHLCMQDFLWDGIKRDRLVWIGDMHPEVSTINAVFGFNDVVPASLDLTRDVTPVEQWMNGISSYSMWWVLIHEELWRHRGDRRYLEAQKPSLGPLLERLANLVGPDGRERIDGQRFLDWPSSPNEQGVTAGLQALLVMTLDAGARLMAELGDERVARVCLDASDRARRVTPDPNGSKSGAALLVLAGMRDPRETAATVLLPGGPAGVSTFYGFYVLGALAKAGHDRAALDLIRTYWGGMLDLGATTFWEDFDVEWMQDASRIDELVPEGRQDVHGDRGAYCYAGFRHSLCHGWASGPTAWLSRHVLGVSPAAPGFAKATIAPMLGDLDWAEGTYPTPTGAIHVRHERQPDGTIRSWVTAPADVDIEAVGTTLMPVTNARSAPTGTSPLPQVAAAATTDQGFVPIFDGTSLAGWEGKPGFWRVENGAIVGETTAERPTEGNTYLVWRQGLVDDFELVLGYRLQNHDSNSGVQYRSRDLGAFVVGGYQADIDDGRHAGTLHEEQSTRGVITSRGQRITVQGDGTTEPADPIGDPAALLRGVRQGDWNELRIVARGNVLQHFVNGRLMTETIDDQAGARAFQGVLALELRAGPPMRVEFKDIRLKRLRLAGERRKLVLVAGRPSHGPGEHEYRAGAILLKRCLDAHFGRAAVPRLMTDIHAGGWPADPTAFANADAIFFFTDGGDAHPVIQRNRLAEIGALAKRGVGIACLHYAVEVPREKGGPEFLDWMGGYFEPHWSVNPHWRLAQVRLAEGHPITRGVRPFEIDDEWYYHLRFREPADGVTNILTAVPPDATRERPDGSHSNNAAVRSGAGSRETLAWACERPDGGRGFGCTGAHFHRIWGEADFRTLMLNALVWTAGLDVPPAGIAVDVSAAELTANLDDK